MIQFLTNCFQSSSVDIDVDGNIGNCIWISDIFQMFRHLQEHRHRRPLLSFESRLTFQTVRLLATIVSNISATPISLHDSAEETDPMDFFNFCQESGLQLVHCHFQWYIVQLQWLFFKKAFKTLKKIAKIVPSWKLKRCNMIYRTSYILQ